MTKLVIKGLLAALVVLFLIMGGVATKMLFDEPFFYYGTLPIPVLTTQLRRGEELQLFITRCSRADEEHVYPISRRLVRIDMPQVPIDLPGNVSSVRPGCTTSVSRGITIPKTFPPAIGEEIPFPAGTYKVVGSSEIGGRLRNLAIPWESETFEVLP